MVRRILKIVCTQIETNIVHVMKAVLAKQKFSILTTNKKVLKNADNYFSRLACRILKMFGTEIENNILHDMKAVLAKKIGLILKKSAQKC